VTARALAVQRARVTMCVMSAAFALVIVVLASVTLLWSLVMLAMDKPLNDALFWGLAVLEAALVGQSIAGFVALGWRSRPIEGVTFGAYLVTIVLALPIAVLWGVSDKSRWGMGVVAVGCFTVIVLTFRLLQLWAAHA
jgi:hypothetical protein